MVSKNWGFSPSDHTEPFEVVVSRLSLQSLWSSADVERVDIGLPHCRPRRTSEVKERKEVIKDNKMNVELERAMRRQTCKLTMHTV